MFDRDEQPDPVRMPGARIKKRALRRAKKRIRLNRTSETPPPSLRRPRYERVADAPVHVTERAIRERLPWIHRYVREGCPYGRLLSYARMYGRRTGIPRGEWPSSSTISRWSRQWQYWGLRGLL